MQHTNIHTHTHPCSRRVSEWLTCRWETCKVSFISIMAFMPKYHQILNSQPPAVHVCACVCESNLWSLFNGNIHGLTCSGVNILLLRKAFLSQPCKHFTFVCDFQIKTLQILLHRQDCLWICNSYLCQETDRQTVLFMYTRVFFNCEVWVSIVTSHKYIQYFYNIQNSAWDLSQYHPALTFLHVMTEIEEDMSPVTTQKLKYRLHFSWTTVRM